MKPRTLVCDHCSRTFEPLKTRQASLVRGFANDGADEIGIECPYCEKYTKFNPTAFMQGKPCQKAFPTYRCPVSACAGYVDFVTDDDGDFWGCGECGAIWYDKKKLLEEITAIIKKFPYRKKCYQKAKGEWRPADAEKEPADYDELVYEEPEDEAEDYVRG